MIKYEVGDMFLSNADCLVNTVNCEGYMGKGVAYQFKLKFPENNKDYVKACKSGRLYVGTLHFYEEDGVMIINFPTKNKWREKSRINYIEIGLDQMVQLLPQLHVKTVAIPPLGCGNGGLNWQEVKRVIEEKLFPVQENYSFLIYEPSKNFTQDLKPAPKLGVSSLVLMQIVMKLEKPNSMRLQETAYFMNIFLKENFFMFDKYKNGPISSSIDFISKSIQEYQNYYGLQNIKETYMMTYNVLCSNKTDKKLEKLKFAIERAVTFVNAIGDDNKINGVATALFLIERNANSLTKEQLIELFKEQLEDKVREIQKEDIVFGIDYLESKGIIEKNILDVYQISEYL